MHEEAENVEEFWKLLRYSLENDVGLTEIRAASVATQFANLEEFLNAPEMVFYGGFNSITGKKLLKLTEDQVKNILWLQKCGYLKPELSTQENYLKALGRVFTARQLEMIRGLSLDELIPNPFLISALGLKTPEEVLRSSVYWRAGRSVVTSMGMFVENLLEQTSPYVQKIRNPQADEKGWDIKKIKPGGRKQLFQIKSGPNDMDKDQVVVWAQKIAALEVKGIEGFIGITYGSRELKTVTSTLLSNYLPDADIKTLIGRELWDFLGDDPEFHTKLCGLLREAAYQILGQESFVEEIDLRVLELEKDFIAEYGSGEDGVKKYIEENL